MLQYIVNEKIVLILVLVEVVLGEVVKVITHDGIFRLNPCFSGSCSWRLTNCLLSGDCLVLILVLVEVVLGVN